MRNPLLISSMIAALISSLCCITPVIALVAGISGLASTFSWLDPARPFFVVITIAVLGFAWYIKFRPKAKYEVNCECEPAHSSFWHTRKFLSIVTIFVVLMLTFPLYAQIFYPKAEKSVIVVDESDIQTATFKINGMTCNACAVHVDHEVNRLSGIIKVSTSYEKGNAIVEFDKTKTSFSKIEEAINSTGYSVTNKKAR
ncbi:mercuric transport protein MerTP [Algoriphagus persicinus]|uniref:mercuric transport protein MerTP n=1 Tax=Algoriphagus persicinus TaxID=3108754 RepID=UPI002B3E6C83|nr:mercuric transport protein MerTP [Algoriphagus sp. E1-3-M2]MEB2787082.1 mercuric transport protein MerTP [Algoriphagus sp. E1-3-M2]